MHIIYRKDIPTQELTHFLSQTQPKYQRGADRALIKLIYHFSALGMNLGDQLERKLKENRLRYKRDSPGSFNVCGQPPFVTWLHPV